MERVFSLTYNGQQVQQQDFTDIGQYGLMDDRVFAELFRMTPYDGATVAKGILPNGGTSALVASNGATGTVLVQPFRALVGSRTAEGTSAKDNWRDIRSTIFVGSSTSLTLAVSIGANSSGNPRWDLVYAAVSVDANDTTTTRKVKDPTTKVVSTQTVSTNKVTNVTLGVTAGTAAASPTWPSAPTDSGSTYYIPLAYVRVPNGFGASSTVGAGNIAVVANCISVSPVLGGSSLKPATTLNDLTSAQQQAWGSSGNRPDQFLPSTACGYESLFILLDLYSGTPSHASGGLLDDSRDWRNRFVRYTAVAQNGVGGSVFSSNIKSSDATRRFPQATVEGKYAQGSNGYTWTGLGSTHYNTPYAAITLYGDNTAPHYSMNPGSVINIQADPSDGYLYVSYTGSPGVVVAIWADFTTPYV